MTRLFLHPLTVRVWHWINAVLFIALILTGIQIRYRDALFLMSYRSAVDVHNWIGFVLIANYLLWLAYYLISGNIRVYVPELNPKRLVKSMVLQARYYGYGIFVGEKNPHHASFDNKFNPMQKMAYLSIMMFLIPVQILSGILLWDVKLFAPAIAFVGGVKIVDSVHVVISMFFTAFLFVHIYLTTLGHTPMEHIKAMFTGFEEFQEHPSL